MKYTIKNLLNGQIEIEKEEQKVSYDLNGIEIPIIQRDYAQGRDSAKFIRNRFLDSIFEALAKNITLEMDFVYGSIKEVKDGNSKYNIFLPLDGQQRLTTLFLLYWFLINTEDLKEMQLEKERKLLKKFSYSTRSTARLFCEKLSSIGYRGNVKESIISSAWFHKSYEKDPTVMGMLTTLQDIQQKYDEKKLKLFKNMDTLCFYILPLDGFDLTDELYIKMNARGKPLTDFENLKADIINWITSDKNEYQKEFNTLVSYGESKIPWCLSLASKFDNSWTDIFWKEAISNEREDYKIVDPYFIRFLKRFFLNHFIISSEENAKAIEASEQFKLFYSSGNEENNKYQSFEDYKEFIEPNTLKKLEKVLDSLKTNQDSIRKIIKPVWDTKDNWFLYDSKITQIQRILFFAVTQYLEHNIYNEKKFQEWIRVTWNIIIDPDIRSIGAMITALKLINKLSKSSSDIYKAFLEDSFNKLIDNTENIHKYQLMEEKRKIELLDKEWSNIILEAEAHPLFQGNIGFLLSDDISEELFLKRYEHASLIFNKSGTNKDYLNEYKVFRYCISQFKTWDEVRDFNYINDSKNWQISLRKNKSIKKSILDLCSLDKKEDIEIQIKFALNSTSSISGWEDTISNKARVQLIHFNLYHYLELVNCTQKKNISEIRWRHELVYFVRPRAWHDKILIDGYRHIIINNFCKIMKIQNDKKCASSDFIIGEQIEFRFNKHDNTWEVVFNGNNEIYIRKYNKEQELLSEKTVKNNATNNETANIIAENINKHVFK